MCKIPAFKTVYPVLSNTQGVLKEPMPNHSNSGPQTVEKWLRPLGRVQPTESRVTTLKMLSAFRSGRFPLNIGLSFDILAFI